MAHKRIAPRHCVADSLTLPSSVGYLIKRCGSVMTAIVEEAFRGQPLTFTQWVVLLSLRRQNSHLSPTKLSNESGYDIGALTRTVDVLERKGYVRRTRSKQDRRTVIIALTSAGARQADAYEDPVSRFLNELIEPFSKREVDFLIPLLRRLYERLQNAPRKKVELASRRKGQPKGS